MSSFLMSNKLKSKKSLMALACFSVIALTGCGGDSDSDVEEVIPTVEVPVVVTYEYEVSVTNLTSNQPLSPITLLTHDEEFMPFSIGVTASSALELLAESGDNAEFLALESTIDSASDSAPLAPGSTYTHTLETEDTTLNLSILSMLVNTNDAFTGLNSHDLSDYAVGDEKSLRLSVYDSGTEANSEVDTTIPGPATMGTGEGFNVARDDIIDVVTMHAGVVSQDDGLTNSVLLASHRFDNLVAKVSIKRIK